MRYNTNTTIENILWNKHYNKVIWSLSCIDLRKYDLISFSLEKNRCALALYKHLKRDSEDLLKIAIFRLTLYIPQEFHVYEFSTVRLIVSHLYLVFSAIS